MNELLRLISKSLKPFGYHVRKFNAQNYLSIPALKNASSLSSLQAASDKLNTLKDANLNHMIVYVRTCIRENRNIDATPRVTGANLNETALRCLRSLIYAVNYVQQHKPDGKIEVVFLDDRSDANFQDLIKSLAAQLSCEWCFEQTEQTGQGASLHQQFSAAKDQNALVYFCEDDYLHEQDAILTCWNFYLDMATELGAHMLLYPQEHRVLYSDHYPSYILAGRDRHWRTMQHATHTFITHGHVVRDHWDYFENTKYVGIKKHRKKGSEAKTTNRLFRHIPGFSPLKPAAVHLQFEDTLPPLYDWRPLWNAMAEDDSAASPAVGP